MERLPVEIQKEILLTLDPVSILSVCQLNRYHNKFISSMEEFHPLFIVRLLSTFIVSVVTKDLPSYTDDAIHNIEDWLQEFIIKTNPKFKNKSISFIRAHILNFKQNFLEVESKKEMIRVATLGDSGIGKTALMYRYVRNMFSPLYKATIGADFMTKEAFFFGKAITIQFWDTAGFNGNIFIHTETGQERFRSIGRVFYRCADSILLAHDISDSKSFDSLPMWLQEIHDNKEDSGAVPIILVGTKIDKKTQRQTSFKDALQFAQQHHLMYLETSSKDDINVQLMFRLAAFVTFMAKDLKKSSLEWPETRPDDANSRSPYIPCYC